MTPSETERLTGISLAKQVELHGSVRNRDHILIEKVSDSLDEVQMMGGRELAIRNLDRESSMPRQVRRAESLERLEHVFRDVFNDEDLEISRETSAKDIPDWDSVMHVSLIVNVEKAFGVRFSSSEVARLQNAGELSDLIESKGR
jgi:acyl carrier protein